MGNRTKLFKHWYLLTLRGALIIILAIFSFMKSADAGIKFIKFFELFAIVSGLLLIQISVTNRKHINWYLTLAQGLLDFSFGIMLWIIPAINPSTIPMVLAVWFLYSGIIQSVESFVIIHENIHNWWFELMNGMLSFVMAFLLITFRLLDRHELFIIIGIFAAIHGLFTFFVPLLLVEPES